MKKIILLVITIYLLIAPVTYHPDTKLVLYYPSLGKEKVWNIYKYLDENPNNAPKFHYPPMNYWVTKIELPIVKLIGGREIVDWFSLGSNVAFLDKNIFLYNLATKSPILLLILVTGFIIYIISKKHGFSENRSRLAALIWYLNPITLYSGVMMGQNDILAIFPFILGLYFYYQNPILAFLLFGLGGSIKSFPLIWAIALAGVYPTKSIFKKVYLGSNSIIFYILTLLPFIKYDYFISDVMKSGLAIRMFESVINIGGFKIMIVPLTLVVITLIAMKNSMGKNYLGIATLLVAINLAVLSFSNFNPQWFIWFMPFLAILLANNGGYINFTLICISLFGITFLFDDIFLYWALVSPINPNLINLPSIYQVLGNNNIVYIFRLLLQLISFYWLFKCVKYKN